MHDKTAAADVDEAINTLSSYDDLSVSVAIITVNPTIRTALVVSLGQRKAEQQLYLWDGKRYKEAGAAGMEREIMDSITVMAGRLQERVDANTGTDDASERERKALKRKIVELSRCQNTQRRRSIESTVRTLKMSDSEDVRLDADRSKVNMQNGVYDLITHELIEHDPSQRFTRVLPFEYHPGARAPKFMAHLEYVLPDPETRQYLLEVLASSLLRSRREELVFFLWGLTAGNGKSELMRMVITALGEYATWLDPHTFTSRRASNATQPEMIMALGKALAAVDEPSKDGLDASSIKNLANYADMVLRGLYQASRTERWTATCIMLCNTLPPIDAKDAGIARRPVVIPFKRQITLDMKTRDQRLPEYATMKYGEYVGKTEAAGVFNILIMALKEHQQRGCLLPPMSSEMREATDEYIYQNNAVARFVAQSYERSDSGVVNAKDFHDAFKTYCMNVLGYDAKYIMLPNSIGEAMKALGYEYKVVKNKSTGDKSVRCYVGLTVKHRTADDLGTVAALRNNIILFLSSCPVKEATTDQIASHFSSVGQELLEATLKKMKETGEVIDLGNGRWDYIQP